MPSARPSRGEESRFVFKGTVRKLRASAEAEVKASSRTAVVRVDEVVRAPEALAEVAGHDVTVELGGRDKLKPGAQAMFYAHGWVFGNGLAVYAVDHPVVEPAHAAMSAPGSDPVSNLARADAKTRFDQASVVISGQVVSVTLPASHAASNGFGNGEPTSEHAPLWRDASIEVHAVHKGNLSGKRATVRFPASTDVLWHKAPKFQPGQQGFFMLHRSEPAVSARAKLTAAVSGGAKGTFTALHPADFQPLDQSSTVRALADANGHATRRNGHTSRRRRG